MKIDFEPVQAAPAIEFEPLDSGIEFQPIEEETTAPVATVPVVDRQGVQMAVTPQGEVPLSTIYPDAVTTQQEYNGPIQNPQAEFLRNQKVQQQKQVQATSRFTTPTFDRPATVIPEAEQAELSRFGSARNTFNRSVLTSTLAPAQALAKADEALFERAPLANVGALSKQRSELFQGWQKAAKETYPTDPKYQEEFFASTLPQAAGSQVPFLLTGATGGAMASSVAGALMTAQNEYDAAKQAGATEDEARKAALVGLPIGLTEGLGSIGKGFNPAKGGFKQWIKSIGEEDIQEVGQSVLQTLNASYVSGYDPNKRLTGKELVDTALATTILAGAAGAPNAFRGTDKAPPEVPPDDLSKFGSQARVPTQAEDIEALSQAAAQAEPAPVATPTQQAAATVLGEDAIGLREQEAIQTGKPIPDFGTDADEAIPAPQEAQGDVLLPEEGQDTTQEVAGLSTLDSDTFQRLADVPLNEGFVAYQDQETNDVFQVPVNATPDDVEIARLQAREASKEAEFNFLKADQEQEALYREREAAATREIAEKTLREKIPVGTKVEQVSPLKDWVTFHPDPDASQQKVIDSLESEGWVKSVMSGTGNIRLTSPLKAAEESLRRKSLVPSSPAKDVWDDAGQIQFMLDRELPALAESEKNLKRAESGTLTRQGERVTMQQATEEVQARRKKVDILQRQLSALNEKIPPAKEAVKKMKRPKKGEEGSTSIPQAVLEAGQSLYRKGIEFKDWSASMVKNLGAEIQPFLQQIWDGITAAVNRLSPTRNKQAGSVAIPSGRPRRQVYGRQDGAEYTPTSIKPIQDLVRKVIFDGTKKVSKAQTTRAKNLAYEWGGGDGRALANEMSKHNPFAPEVAKAELYRYALEMTVQGDPSLQKYILENDANMPTINPNMDGTASDAGLTLRLRQLMDHPAWKVLQEVSQQADDITKGVMGGDVNLDLLKIRLGELKLDPKDVLDALSGLNDKGGQALKDVLGKLLTSEPAKKARKKKAAKVEEEQQQDAEAERATGEAGRAEEEYNKAAERTATAILDAFDQSQTEWLRPEADRNAVREIIRGEMKGQFPLPDPGTKWEQYINPLAARLEAVGVTSQTSRRLAQATHDQVVASRASKAWKAMEAAKAKAERLAEAKAKRDAASAERTANAPTDSAQKILNGFEQFQTEWIRPEGKKDAVREVINNRLRGETVLPEDSMKWRAFIKPLSDELVGLGVKYPQAQQLAQATYDQLTARRSASRQKAMQAAFDQGSIRPIVEAILDTPISERTGDWVKRTTDAFFQDAGLSPQLAETAARVFAREINQKFEQAADKALAEFVQNSTPWSARLNSPKREVKTKAQKNLEQVRKAVRLQATDPSKSFTAEVAKQNNWTGFTDTQHRRMSEIDARLNAPDLLPTESVKLKNELFDIARKAKLPPTKMDALAEAYNGSALSSLATLGSNLYGPVGDVVGQYMANNFQAMLPGGGGVGQLIFNAEQLAKAVMQVPRAFGYALKNDTYTLHDSEVLSQLKALKGLLESAGKDWESGNAIRMAKAIPKMAYGSMDFVRRILSSADQANFTGLEQYHRALYGSKAMRQKGYTTRQIRDLSYAADSVFNHGYEQGISLGMSEADAQMRGRDLVKEAYLEGIQDKVGTEDAQQVARAARQDALLTLGQRDREMEEGFLSRLGPNWAIDSLSRMRSEGTPIQRIFATILYGFVRTPYQLVRYGANYTPYGAMRWAIHKAKTRNGGDTFWQQSFGTDLQARQRLIQSIGGTVASSMLLGLMTGSGDEEKRKGTKIVVTGNGPGYEDPTYRDAWLKEHKQNAFEIWAGGKRRVAIPYARGPMEGLSFIFSAAGAADDYTLRHGKKGDMGVQDNLNKVLEIAGTYMYSAAQRGANFGGRNALMEAINNRSKPGVKLASTASYAASALIPAAGLTRSIETILMSPRDRSDAYAAMFAANPVTAPFGEPAINGLGDPVGDVTALGRSYNTGLPILVQEGTADPVYRLIGDKMAAPSVLRRSDVERAMGTRFSEAQWRQVATLYGTRLKELILDNYERIEGMDSEDANKAMSELSTKAKIETLEAL